MPHGFLPGTYSIALVEVQQARSARKCVRQQTRPGYKDIPLYSCTLQRSFFYLFWFTHVYVGLRQLWLQKKAVHQAGVNFRVWCQAFDSMSKVLFDLVLMISWHIFGTCTLRFLKYSTCKIKKICASVSNSELNDYMNVFACCVMMIWNHSRLLS